MLEERRSETGMESEKVSRKKEKEKNLEGQEEKSILDWGGDPFWIGEIGEER